MSLNGNVQFHENWFIRKSEMLFDLHGKTKPDLRKPDAPICDQNCNIASNLATLNSL